jgi:hypothetical protein
MREPPVPMHDHAVENLRFIRETMERAGAFTSIPGWGGVAMGATAVCAALIIGPPTESWRWLGAWLVEAGVAMSIALVAMSLKSRRSGTPLLSAPARRFALAYLPPLAAGAVLTAMLGTTGSIARLPAVWLLLYGTAVATGGAFTVPIVSMMGVAFMALGAIAAAVPATYGNWFMAAGFGGLHIGFGLVIARHYGG